MPAQAPVGLLWEGGGGGSGEGGCFAVYFQCSSERTVRVCPDVCFALSSLVSGNQKHKFEIDRNTLFELTLILSLNLRTIQYMCEAKIILQWSSKSLFPQTLP